MRCETFEALQRTVLKAAAHILYLRQCFQDQGSLCCFSILLIGFSLQPHLLCLSFTNGFNWGCLCLSYLADFLSFCLSCKHLFNPMKSETGHIHITCVQIKFIRLNLLKDTHMQMFAKLDYISCWEVKKMPITISNWISAITCNNGKTLMFKTQHNFSNVNFLICGIINLKKM